MSDKPPEEIKQDQNQIRQQLVTTAVNFLLNPSVIDKPNEQKTAFLRKKGLTEAEITLAYERTNNESKYKEIQSKYAANGQGFGPPLVPLYRNHQVSFWTKLTRFSSSVVILGVALFGAHYIYKKYIERLIFGEVCDDKSQRLEKQLEELISSLTQIQVKICELEENVKGQKEQIDKIVQNEINEYYPTPVALRELKTEIASVKSLMLNRHQFPPLPKTSPSIPQWQLPSKENEIDGSKQNGESSHIQHVDEKNLTIKPSVDTSSDDSDSIELINGVNKTSESSKSESLKDENSETLSNNLPVS